MPTDQIQDDYAPSAWNTSSKLEGFDHVVPSGQRCRLRMLNLEQLVVNGVIDLYADIGWADEVFIVAAQCTVYPKDQALGIEIWVFSIRVGKGHAACGLPRQDGDDLAIVQADH